MATSPAQPSECKDHVRLNKVRPASYGRDMILLDEEREAFERAACNLQNRYRPSTFEEIELVQILHITYWRLDRAIANEHNLYTLVEQQQLSTIDVLFGEQDPRVRRALAQSAGLQANMRIFDQLGRHIARLHRIIVQSRRDLEFRIARRQQSEQTAETEELTEQSQPAAAHPAKMPQFTGSLKEFKRKQWLRQQEKLHNQTTGASTGV